MTLKLMLRILGSILLVVILAYVFSFNVSANLSLNKYIYQPQDQNNFIKESSLKRTLQEEGYVKYSDVDINILEAVNYSDIIEHRTNDCTGNWVSTTSTGHINMSYTYLSDWNVDSIPSFVNETMNTPNIVGIGHNICTAENCFMPTTQFGQIINAQVGDPASACINNTFYQGEIVRSEAVDENAMYIMGNWIGQDSVTLFTCFGNCKDAACSATDQRWAIAFTRN